MKNIKDEKIEKIKQKSSINGRREWKKSFRDGEVCLLRAFKDKSDKELGNRYRDALLSITSSLFGQYKRNEIDRMNKK